ncbi:hypothetical protein M3Y96_00265600 [Aphelenchoides besseyi]|nr:hypothetical protein M3Y96_00265600 [Aphelenchoides besseyi]
MHIGQILFTFYLLVQSSFPSINDKVIEVTKGEPTKLECLNMTDEVLWIGWSQRSGLMECDQYTPTSTVSEECQVPTEIRNKLPSSLQPPPRFRCCSSAKLTVLPIDPTTHFFCFTGSSSSIRHFRVQTQNCAHNPCRNGGRCEDRNTHSDGTVGRVHCVCRRDYFGRFCDEVVDRRIQWSIFGTMCVVVIIECLCGSFLLFRERFVPPSLVRRFPRLRRQHRFEIDPTHRRAFVDILNYGINPQNISQPLAQSTPIQTVAEFTALSPNLIEFTARDSSETFASKQSRDNATLAAETKTQG